MDTDRPDGATVTFTVVSITQTGREVSLDGGES